MLDMHSLDGDGNPATWCGEDSSAGCHAGNEIVLREAWLHLARSLCAENNVILADLFNEPYVLPACLTAYIS